MRKCAEYRADAKQKVNQYGATFVVIYLVYTVIVGALTATGIGNLIVTGPLTLGFAMLVAGAAKGDKPSITGVFSGFNDFVRALTAYVEMLIFTTLWSLLFFIPGIIKSYSYSMTYYIMMDDASVSPTDAITQSRKMMNGHKWQLFCLDLSYIGWHLLACLTLGILEFWIAPKVEMAHYLFYQDIKAQPAE